MDIRDDQNHVFNKTVAKRLGLYQMLDPETTKYRGKNVYRILMTLIMLYVSAFGVILILSGVYYWTQNILLSIDYLWKAISPFIMSHGMWVILHHSNDIWNCLSITRYGFTSFSNWNRHILDRWRERSVWLTTVYAITYYSSLAFYLASTLVFRKDMLPFKNHDGSVGFYRQNVVNFYFIVSDETYNAHYYVFYFFEALYLILMVLIFLIFDILLITLCFAICCQMQMICFAFESAGHKSLCDAHSPSGEYDF